jgi:plastocyanin
MRRGNGITLAAAAAATLAAGVVAAPAGSAPTAEIARERVSVEDNYFDPRSVTVHRGEVVRWAWHGENRHNVTFVKVPHGASRRGATTRRDGHWRRRFWRPGAYRYVCTLHAGMTGSVLVLK